MYVDLSIYIQLALFTVERRKKRVIRKEFCCYQPFCNCKRSIIGRRFKLISDDGGVGKC